MSITTIVVVAAVLGVIALVLVSSNRAGQEGVPDIRVLSQLRQAGSKLEKPHQIDFFMYFPSESAANSVAQTLASQGYNVSVKPSAQSNPEWLVQAVRTMVPKVGALVEIRKSFSALASENGGTYDGWGAGVVR